MAFQKPEGGVRSIAVGSLYNRLTGRLEAYQMSSRFHEHISSMQVGEGVEHGCDPRGMHYTAYVLCNVTKPELNKVIRLAVSAHLSCGFVT